MELPQITLRNRREHSANVQYAIDSSNENDDCSSGGEYIPETSVSEESEDTSEVELSNNRKRKHKFTNKFALDGSAHEPVLKKLKKLETDTTAVIPSAFDERNTEDEGTPVNRKKKVMKPDSPVPSCSKQEETDDQSTDNGASVNLMKDINEPGIYINQVCQSKKTKSGKDKKHSRVYNSYHYCDICKKKVSNFAQHIERRGKSDRSHQKCPEIQDIIND
jgi:hypothetical protein